MRRRKPAHSRSRKTNFWILPVEVFGSSPKATDLGCLEVSQSAPNVVDNGLFRGPHPRLQRDKGLRNFAPMFVWNCDHGNFHHCGMARHGLLYFDCGDVLATRNNPAVQIWGIFSRGLLHELLHRMSTDVESPLNAGLAGGSVADRRR